MRKRRHGSGSCVTVNGIRFLTFAFECAHDHVLGGARPGWAVRVGVGQARDSPPYDALSDPIAHGYSTFRHPHASVRSDLAHLTQSGCAPALVLAAISDNGGDRPAYPRRRGLS